MTAERPRDGSSDAVCDGSSDAVSRSVAPAGPILARPSVFRSVSAWLGGNRLGLAVLALIVGAGAGLGAAVFRELIYAFTWLATGYTRFGQQGHAPSLHFPALGIFFVLVIPVVGGLLYGPLIQRFAREARGHGVPEVMLAVAENGGRIRPRCRSSRRSRRRSASALVDRWDAKGRSSRSDRLSLRRSGSSCECRRTGCGSSLRAAPRAGSPRRSTRRSQGCSSGLRSCCASSRSTLCSQPASRRSPAMSSAACSSAPRRSSPKCPTTSFWQTTAPTCSSPFSRSPLD